MRLRDLICARLRSTVHDIKNVQKERQSNRDFVFSQSSVHHYKPAGTENYCVLQGWNLTWLHILSFFLTFARSLTPTHPHTRKTVGQKTTANCVFLGQCQCSQSEKLALHLRDGPSLLCWGSVPPKRDVEYLPQLCTHRCVTWINPAAGCQSQGHTGHKKKRNHAHSDSRERSQEPHIYDRSLIKHRHEKYSVFFRVCKESSCISGGVCAADSRTASWAPHIQSHAGSFNEMLNNWFVAWQ